MSNKEDLTIELLRKRAWIEECVRQSIEQRVPLELQPIESGAQGLGIPDVYFLLDGHDGWLEVKRILDTSHPFVKYRPQQLPRLRRWRAYGTFTATLGITADLECVLSVPDLVLLNTDTTRVNLLSNKLRVSATSDSSFEALRWIVKQFYLKGGKK